MAEITSKIGRRKTAVARISMTPGKGQIKINTISNPTTKKEIRRERRGLNS